MSATITVIQDIVGKTFVAKLKLYVDSSTYYVLDGQRTAGGGTPQPFRFVIDPATYIKPGPGFATNPSGWAAGYIALLDGILN